MEPLIRQVLKVSVVGCTAVYIHPGGTRVSTEFWYDRNDQVQYPGVFTLTRRNKPSKRFFKSPSGRVSQRSTNKNNTQHTTHNTHNIKRQACCTHLRGKILDPTHLLEWVAPLRYLKNY